MNIQDTTLEKQFNFTEIINNIIENRKLDKEYNDQLYNSIGLLIQMNNVWANFVCALNEKGKIISDEETQDIINNFEEENSKLLNKFNKIWDENN